MSQTQFQQLISDFGSSLGIPDLQPDEFGCCCLKIGDVSFHVLGNPDGSTITVFTEIGELADDVEPDVLRQLLAVNYFWAGTRGATLGVSPESGAVVLAQRLPLSTVTVDSLEQLMKQFVEMAEAGLPGVPGPATLAEAEADAEQSFDTDPNTLRV